MLFGRRTSVQPATAVDVVADAHEVKETIAAAAEILEQ